MGHKKTTTENEDNRKTRSAPQQTSFKLRHLATRNDVYKKSAPAGFPVPVGGPQRRHLNQ